MIIRNGTCFTCPNNSFYDASSKTCISCPEDRYYEPSNKTCTLRCSGGSFFDKTSNSCKCPTDKPYFNGTLCLACNPPQHWDDTKKACIGGC